MQGGLYLQWTFCRWFEWLSASGDLYERDCCIYNISWSKISMQAIIVAACNQSDWLTWQLGQSSVLCLCWTTHMGWSQNLHSLILSLNSWSRLSTDLLRKTMAFYIFYYFIGWYIIAMSEKSCIKHRHPINYISNITPQEHDKKKWLCIGSLLVRKWHI